MIGAVNSENRKIRKIGIDRGYLKLPPFDPECANQWESQLCRDSDVPGPVSDKFRISQKFA